jgi:predicted transcriptional regulator
MTKEEIQTIFERVLGWPSERLDDVAEVLLQMEAANDMTDDLTEAELADLEEGLAEADRGEFASEEEIQALLDRYRR